MERRLHAEQGLESLQTKAMQFQVLWVVGHVVYMPLL